MNELMTKFKNMEIWKQLLIVFACIGVVVVIAVVSLKPDTSSVLYSNLDPNETVEIEQEIAKLGIDSTVNEEATSISIDKEKIATVKAHLSSMGLPNSGDPGFELLDETSIGATKFDKEKRYERALAGDIQQGLVEGFDFINKAIVQLNYEVNSKIFEEDAKSKAAVTVHVKNNKSLTEEQVQSIRNFVASSVKNLSVENVDVMDKSGISYAYQGGNSTSGGGYSKQIEILDQTEARIQKDIMTMLARNFGAENVTLVVRAEVNFDEIVRNIEKYDPLGTMISRQEATEKITKSEGETVIEPGTDSNGTVPDYELEDGATGVYLNQDKKEIIENFEVGKTVETIKENPELTNIKVTATINESVNTENMQDFIAEWEELIANAAGIQINEDGTYENGNVKVSPQVFITNGDALEDGGEGTLAGNENRNIVTLIFIIAGIGLALLAMIGWFIHKRREEIVVTQHGVPFGDGNGYNDALSVDKNNSLSDEEQSKQRSELLINQIDKQQKTKRIEFGDLTEDQKEIATRVRTVAEENPERTAEYIKKLINEG